MGPTAGGGKVRCGGIREEFGEVFKLDEPICGIIAPFIQQIRFPDSRPLPVQRLILDVFDKGYFAGCRLCH